MLNIINPSSALLEKYIECFYVFNKKSAEEYKYIAFPHYNTGITFIKNSTINRYDYALEFIESKDSKINIELLGKYTTPILVSYTGLFEEYTIIFKPLGINRFISEDYYSVAGKNTQAYKNKDWEEVAELLFETKNIDVLESFLIEKYHKVNGIDKIEKAIELLENINQQYTIPEVAEIIGMNLKSFQRHFLKQVGCSAIDYKRIVRFRNSISSKIKTNEIKSLTEISYENNYFDQSYFIKEFKKLTNHNPKNFFKEISQVDGDKIIWEIL